MASNKERTGNVKYDLGTFVVSVNRLKSQGKPVLVLFSVVSNVVRWKHPFASFVVIPASLTMIVFCPEYFMGLLMLPLPLMMLINLIRKLGTRKTVPIDYKKLFVRKDESPELIAKRNAMLKAKEHLDMYLDILIEIQELCNKISTKFEFFYSLFYWKIWRQALLFYLLVICGIIGLFTIRLRFMVAVLLFSLSFFNTGFKQAIIDLCSHIYNSISRVLQAKSRKDVGLESFDKKEVGDEGDPEQDIQVREQVPVPECIADSSSSSDSEDLNEKPENKPETIPQPEEQQGKQKMKHGLSFVSKIASSTLASIRRRRTGGKCTSCSADFSSILKKRNYCRHCGYSYCSSCCRQRVPKIVFGATAPAAYEERVLVCNSCYAFLMNRMRGTNTEFVE